MNKNQDQVPALSSPEATLDEQSLASFDELSIVELEERLEFFVWCGNGTSH